MNVTGNLEKVLTKDLTGQLMGVYFAEKALGDDYGTDAFGMIDAQLHKAWTDPHFPNLNNVRHDLMSGSLAKVFRPAITAFLAGLVGKELNVHPLLTKVARIAEKVGANVAISTAGVAIVNRSTVEHSPLGNSGERHSAGGGINPFARGN